MRRTLILAFLVALTALYLFWARNLTTRVPGYTTPIWETPTLLNTPTP